MFLQQRLLERILQGTRVKTRVPQFARFYTPAEAAFCKMGFVDNSHACLPLNSDDL